MQNSKVLLQQKKKDYTQAKEAQKTLQGNLVLKNSVNIAGYRINPSDDLKNLIEIKQQVSYVTTNFLLPLFASCMYLAYCKVGSINAFLRLILCCNSCTFHWAMGIQKNTLIDGEVVSQHFDKITSQLSTSLRILFIKSFHIGGIPTNNSEKQFNVI